MKRHLGWLALLIAAALPFSAVTVPAIFDGPFHSPGTLQLLTLCLIFAALAQTYDLLFGHTGLMSFGHALYFACGAYGTAILTSRAGWPLWTAALAAITLAATLSAALGAVTIRVTGVAFAMVTLAFAQVGSVLVLRDPGQLTGGSDGIALDAATVPDALVGVTNTVNLYWLALAYLAIVVIVCRTMLASTGGRVLTGVRDAELRLNVLGINPARYKLAVLTIAGTLAAGAGVVYALAAGGAAPRVASTDLTLSLLIMVVIGGPATRWGAVLGGILYTYLDHRLTTLAILPEPLMVLGVAFILLVYFAPGGLAGIAPRLRRVITSMRSPQPPAERA